MYIRIRLTVVLFFQFVCEGGRLQMRLVLSQLVTIFCTLSYWAKGSADCSCEDVLVVCSFNGITSGKKV